MSNEEMLLLVLKTIEVLHTPEKNSYDDFFKSNKKSEIISQSLLKRACLPLFKLKEELEKRCKEDKNEQR